MNADPRALRLVEHGSEQASLRSSRSDERVLHLTTRGVPSPGFLRWCLERLGAEGPATVFTTALAPNELAPFLETGFSFVEHLSLLELEIADWTKRGPSHAERATPPDDGRAKGGWALRRARQGDRSRVLTVDHAAFEPFWHLDDGTLEEALGATPDRWFRVALRPTPTLHRRRHVVGYAITGSAGDQGFIQRLAVHPAAQSQGAGRALLADGVRWLERRGATRIAVNTQESNDRALALYSSFGFQMSAERLSVLGAVVTERPA